MASTLTAIARGKFWEIMGIHEGMSERELAKLLRELTNMPNAPNEFIIGGEIYSYSELQRDDIQAIILENLNTRR